MIIILEENNKNQKNKKQKNKTKNKKTKQYLNESKAEQIIELRKKGEHLFKARLLDVFAWRKGIDRGLSRDESKL